MKKIFFVFMLVLVSFSFADTGWVDYRSLTSCGSIKTAIINNYEDSYAYNCDQYRRALVDRPEIGCDYEFYKAHCGAAEQEYIAWCAQSMNGIQESIRRCEENPDSVMCDQTGTSIMTQCSWAIQLGEYYYCDLNAGCELCKKEGITTDACKYGRKGTWPPQQDHCSNTVQDEDEQGLDCGGLDCLPCEFSITLNPSTGDITADGETRSIIIIEVNDGEKPVAGKKVDITLAKNSGNWDGSIGQISQNSVTTDSDGMAMVEYIPPLITAEELDGSIEIGLEARTKEATGIGVYKLVPEEGRITVADVSAIQTLNDMKIPMVSGKQLAVFIVVNSTGPEMFSAQEDRRYMLTFIAEAKDKWGAVSDDFTSFPKFVLGLDEHVTDPAIEMVEGQDVNEYLSLLGVEKADDSIYRVYIFYLDHPKTDLLGYYSFDGIVTMLKEDQNGEKKESTISRRRITADVYPSKQFHLKTVPVGIGVWHPDICEYCVYFDPNSGYVFDCKHDDVLNPIHSVFDYAWEGRMDRTALDRVLSEGAQSNPGTFKYVCAQGFRTQFTQAELNQMTSQTPATYDQYNGATGTPLTPEQRYNQLAANSIIYLKAVMPLAEEDIIVHMEPRPQMLPQGGAYAAYPFAVTMGLESKYDNYLYQSRYGRVVGFVPVDGAKEMFSKSYSELDFDVEGYSNSLISNEVVLVNTPLSGYTTMTHEIAHTYCAIDEYEGAWTRFLQAGMKIPLLCSYSEGPWINSRRGDTRGTPVKNGFWVEKRRIMGTQNNPKFSFMGDASDEEQWITDELYYGMGRNLHIFPIPVEIYTPNHPYTLK